MRHLIFDAHNLFIRNFAVNPTLDVNGEPVGGIVGTIRSVKSMVAEVRPDRVFMVWDGPGGSMKRRGIMAEYKEGRRVRLNRELESSGAREDADSMREQMGRVRPLLRLLGATQLEVGDIEADDAIAYLVGCLDPHQKVVVSSDRDLWQLVSPTTSVYWPVKKVYITSESMAADGCLPQNWAIYKALQGDRSDSIPGVRGVGPATIKRLFPELSRRAFSLSEFFQLVEERSAEHPKAAAILAARELVSRNVDIMQLTSPVISATAAGLIRGAIDVPPSFNFTAFRLAMVNQGIQLTDTDLMNTFRAYQMRAINAAA